MALQVERPVEVPVEPGTELVGDLTVPGPAAGVVVFAHGSGSSRHSSRNRAVAGALVERGLATLLLDLLTPEEERAERQTRHLRFDIELLAERLVATVAWLRSERVTAELRLGYFGASTGAGAALVAAARQPLGVAAVVSRGGRPDLAGDWLPRVQAPTLLLVGGDDTAVLPLNEEALGHLGGPSELEIVPGATHLFEEPGALTWVARRAGDWFVEHFGARTEVPR